MYKFEIGDLVEYKQIKSPKRRPMLPFSFKRPKAIENPFDLEPTFDCKVLGKMGIVLSRYPSQILGDTAFPEIPFDRFAMYIVYFQEEMTEYLCYEAELDFA